MYARRRDGKKNSTHFLQRREKEIATNTARYVPSRGAVLFQPSRAKRLFRLIGVHDIHRFDVVRRRESEHLPVEVEFSI